MSPRFDPAITRRRFVRFLTASPLFAHAAVPAFGQNVSAPSRLPDPMVWAPRDLGTLISDPKEALDVFDFEPVAKKNLPPAHFGYMVTGIDDEVTLRANREGFLKFQLRPRRLVNVSMIDMTVEIFGAKYDNPIVIAPTGSNRAFHPDGEVAVANAARVGNPLQILSTAATGSIKLGSLFLTLPTRALTGQPVNPLMDRAREALSWRASAGSSPSQPAMSRALRPPASGRGAPHQAHRPGNAIKRLSANASGQTRFPHFAVRHYNPACASPPGSIVRGIRLIWSGRPGPCRCRRLVTILKRK